MKSSYLCAVGAFISITVLCAGAGLGVYFWLQDSEKTGTGLSEWLI